MKKLFALPALMGLVTALSAGAFVVPSMRLAPSK